MAQFILAVLKTQKRLAIAVKFPKQSLVNNTSSLDIQFTHNHSAALQSSLFPGLTDFHLVNKDIFYVLPRFRVSRAHNVQFLMQDSQANNALGHHKKTWKVTNLCIKVHSC